MAYFSVGVWGAYVVASYKYVSVVGSENNVFDDSGLWVYATLICLLKVQGTSKMGSWCVVHHVYRYYLVPYMYVRYPLKHFLV